MEKVEYGGWENCYRLSNEKIELIVTGDVGPRVIRLGFIGKPNLFKEFSDQMGKTESDEWLSFGGHRLWHAPEAQPRTYYPDLEPVLIQEIENGLVATQKPEPTTGLQKQLKITLSTDKPEVQVRHTLINHSLWAIETAPWAISVMAEGGTAILPLPPRGSHSDFLLPTSVLSMWAYTNLSDPRWVLGERYLLLKQDPKLSKPQKMGILATDGWAAYTNFDCLFVKRVPFQLDGVYPDMGVNFEVFTNEDILEVESLGPLDNVQPKGKIEHLEHWSLYENVPQLKSEADVIKDIIPLLK
jgi:hypothetical protein